MPPGREGPQLHPTPEMAGRIHCECASYEEVGFITSIQFSNELWPPNDLVIIATEIIVLLAKLY